MCSLDGPTDYRLQRLGGFQTWHVPNGDAATEALSRAFFRLTDFPVEDREHVPSETVAIKGGRELFVPKSLKGVAVFSFKRLCGEPRGIPDYLRSEEHTSELQSLMRHSYAVFCLKKQTNTIKHK